MEKRGGKRQPFSRHKGARYTFNIGAPLQDHIEGVKRSATADDLFLDTLVNWYEEDLEKGIPPRHAICYFWDRVKRCREENVLSEEEFKILHNAACNECSPSERIKAAQILIKANPRAFKLPFVADAMVELLLEQKYTLDDTQPLKDLWNDFLQKRPKGKILHNPDDLADLVTRGQVTGYKYLDAIAEVADGFDVSEDCIKKLTSVKGAKGRSRKKSK